MGVLHGGNPVPEPRYLVVTDHVAGSGHFYPFPNIFSVATHGRIGPLGNTRDHIVTDITVGSTRFIGYHTIYSIHGTLPNHTVLSAIHTDTNAFVKGIVHGQVL